MVVLLAEALSRRSGGLSAGPRSIREVCLVPAAAMAEVPRAGQRLEQEGRSYVVTGRDGPDTSPRYLHLTAAV